jgi:hypothetical protein
MAAFRPQRSLRTTLSTAPDIEVERAPANADRRSGTPHPRPIPNAASAADPKELR